MNFTNLPGGLSDGFAMIKSIDKKTTSNGLAYLDIMLCDMSGELNAKLWDYNPIMHGEFSSGDIVKVRGTIAPYKGTDQLRIEKIRKITESDNVDPSEFVPSMSLDGTMMYDIIVSIINEFENEDIKKIVLAIYESRKDRLLYWPAASKMHHAARGGLLYHTLTIIRLAEGLCKIYPYVNRELLIGGAAIHDIAKTDEYELNSAGMVTQYSIEGNLIGHIAKGAMVIDSTAKSLGIESDIPMLLEHMILSHHGEPEFGAAVRPAFIEAELLSTLDNLDAKMYEIAEAVEKTDSGEFSAKIWGLNRKFYNHGKETVKAEANIDEL